jgi:hypothetical protein
VLPALTVIIVARTTLYILVTLLNSRNAWHRWQPGMRRTNRKLDTLSNKIKYESYAVKRKLGKIGEA